MDFFDYISQSDPAGTADVIQSYGYNICNSDLSSCARDLVNFEGEDALKKLCDLHPDKDLILQYFGNNNFYGADGMGNNGRIASFDVIKEKKIRMESRGTDNNMMLVFLMGATLLITAAIITK